MAEGYTSALGNVAEKSGTAPPGCVEKGFSAPPGNVEKGLSAPPGNVEKEFSAPPGNVGVGVSTSPGNVENGFSATPGNVEGGFSAPPGNEEKRFSAAPGNVGGGLGAPPGNVGGGFSAAPGNVENRLSAPPGNGAKGFSIPPENVGGVFSAPPGHVEKGFSIPPGNLGRRFSAPPGHAEKGFSFAPGNVEKGLGTPPGNVEKGLDATPGNVEKEFGAASGNVGGGFSTAPGNVEKGFGAPSGKVERGFGIPSGNVGGGFSTAPGNVEKGFGAPSGKVERGFGIPSGNVGGGFKAAPGNVEKGFGAPSGKVKKGFSASPRNVQKGSSAAPGNVEKGLGATSGNVSEGFGMRLEPSCGVCCNPCRVPVMLSCWHPFCLGCIERVWCQNPELDHGCPVCLKVPLPPDGSGLSPAEVLCDFCLGQRLPASKTCLTCLASLCEAHLQPHLSGDAFRGHHLAPPSMDLSASCCVDHAKPLEMFCKDCRLCVCNVCPILGRHQGHRISVLEHEAAEKRNLLKICLNRLSCKSKQENANINNIQKAAEELKLRLLLDEEERAAKAMVEEEMRAALEVYQEQAEACRQRAEVSEAFARNVTRMYKQDDSVQLLRDFIAAEKDLQTHQQPADHIHPIPIKFDHVESYINSFHKALKTILRTPIENRVKNGLMNRPNAKQVHTLMHRTKSTGDKLLFLRYACSPILDVDTLHPRLRLCESGVTLSKAWLKHSLLDGPQRFDRLPQALARESYFSGRRYWEVDLRQAGAGWWVGVAYRSLGRKGDSEVARLGCNKASWCLKRYDLEYWAFHNGSREHVHPEEDPERLGVFLDYEAGTLSFFDALSGMRHLYTFQAKFTEPLYPAFRLWEGPISLCRLT